MAKKQTKAVAALEVIGLTFPGSNSKAWLDALVEQPTISPQFVDGLCGKLDQTLFEWLRQHAPHEIVEMHQCRSAMTVFLSEAATSHGLVHANSNETIMDYVRDAINVLDKIGAGDFDMEG
jgi:hypothetical protein